MSQLHTKCFYGVAWRKQPGNPCSNKPFKYWFLWTLIQLSGKGLISMAKVSRVLLREIVMNLMSTQFSFLLRGITFDCLCQETTTISSYHKELNFQFEGTKTDLIVFRQWLFTDSSLQTGLHYLKCFQLFVENDCNMVSGGNLSLKFRTVF